MQLFERDSTTIQTPYTEVVENELHFSNQYFTKLHTGGTVAWWLTPRTPEPEVGDSSPTRVAVLCT